MDPISIALTILAIYGMLKRSPQWAGEMAEEWQAAKRGEESPAAAARRQRLIAAGVDPATGGPMRQYLGNRWRDYWLDADDKAAKDRAARLAREEAGEVLSWRERLAARMDDEVTRRAGQWRTRPPADVVPPVAPAPGGNPGPDDGGGADAGETTSPPTDPWPDGPPEGDDHPGVFSGWTRDAPTDTDTDTAPDFDAPAGVWGSTVHDDDTYTPHNTTASDPTPEPDRDPIRVDATAGAPLHTNDQAATAAPAAITAGGTMSNAVAQQAVTGVVSGASEARAIQAAINAATEEYVAKLNRIRSRIGSLGEQTLGTVQMSGKSQVVNYTAAAAEAAAAATANARACTTEVVPLLGSVARAFDRINS